MKGMIDVKECNDSVMINGSSVDIEADPCDNEIKANIVVSEFESTRLWGQVINQSGVAVENALVKLLRVVSNDKGRCVYQGIAHTITDCQGFYQFDISKDCCLNQYKVVVGKAAFGMERIIVDGGNCDEKGYMPPCRYIHRVTKSDEECD